MNGLPQGQRMTTSIRAPKEIRKSAKIGLDAEAVYWYTQSMKPGKAKTLSVVEPASPCRDKHSTALSISRLGKEIA